MSRKSLLLFILFLYLLPAANFFSVNAQVDPNLSGALQRVLDSLKTKYKMIGISAAVVMPDNQEWTGTSGMSNPNTKDSLTTDMLLSMGSVTKTFTCAIILQLAAENKLNLDDPLYKFIPAHNNIDSTITIRQLLNHTSGIYNYTDNDNFWNETLLNLSKNFTQEDILKFVSAPTFKAGTRWEYSNTNYILLGMIIKNITGSGLSEELHKRLLIPFKLNNTFLDIEDTLKGKIACGWVDLNNDNILENTSDYSRTAIYSGAWSAGAMVTNPGDLARWVKHLYSGEVVEKTFMDQMLDFTALSNYQYGFATIKTSLLNRDLWGHTGGIPGFTTYAGYSKQDNVSIAVMLNLDNADLRIIVYDILRTVINYLPTSIVTKSNNKIEKFYLNQNFPNPFNPETNISFTIPSSGLVQLEIFDILGNKVSTLVNELKSPGIYTVKWNAENLPSGIYLYRLKTAGFSETRKLILIR